MPPGSRLCDLLAPEIVEAILDGRQSQGVTLPALMRPFPVEWETASLARQLTPLDRRTAA